jgi:DNA-binding XRE family transcriptional regulator
MGAKRAYITPTSNKQGRQMNTHEKFLLLQKEMGLTNQRTAELLDVNISTVKRWKNGSIKVNRSVIIALSYLKVNGFKEI